MKEENWKNVRFFGMIIGAIIGTMGIEAVSALIKNKKC